MAIKVLLIEDEPMWQQGIQLLLAQEPGIEWVGTVDNADDGEVFFNTYQPDVVLVDWKIKGPRDGLVFAQWLTQHLPSHNIILVTGSPAEQIPSHPYGYVPKSQIASRLVQAILATQAQAL